MSADGASAVRTRGLVPFAHGHDPRRSAGGLTKAERDFRAELEAEHIPAASALLRKVYERAMRDVDSDMAATEFSPPQGPTYAQLFFKLCGLMPKGTDKSLIETLVKETLEQAIAAARARKEGEAKP